MQALAFPIRALSGVCRRLDRLERRSRTRQRLNAAGLAHAASIHTFTTEEELDVLMSLASRVPDNSEAVEVGSYLGASTCYIAAGLVGKNVSLTCIDTWQNETMPDGERDTLSQFKANLKPASAMLKIVRSRTNSLERDSLPSTVSFAFIDGDHSYAAAKYDFELLAPTVMMEGVIAFHDTLYFKGVSRVLGEALASGDWRLDGCCHNLSWIRRTGFQHADGSSV